MKIATWNVNSLRVRLPHLQDWLAATPLDVVGLQELKMQDHDFPHEALAGTGWYAAANGQKTYNGVALLGRQPPEDVRCDIPGFDDHQKRIIAASFGELRVVCAYVPNGQAVGSEKYAYKLDWLARFADYLGEALVHHPQLAVIGDFNIAPTPEDTYDPEAWEGQILCSGPERAALQRILDLGFGDCFDHLPAPEQRYTWWDYRAGGFRRNLGLRIDHVLASAPLLARLDSWHVDLEPRKRERPSDHAPVIAGFAT